MRRAEVRRRAGLLLAAFVLLSHRSSAQSRPWPVAVEALDLATLAGDWYEVAAYGFGAHRRCVSDTRFEWVVRTSRTVDVTSHCSTVSGDQVRSGRIRAGSAMTQGRLTARFGSRILAWLPAVWDDHWILALGEHQQWMLVGDRDRRRMSVLSRWVALDEASLARAIGAARAQGFDVARLAPVPHPHGARAEER